MGVEFTRYFLHKNLLLHSKIRLALHIGILLLLLKFLLEKNFAYELKIIVQKSI